MGEVAEAFDEVLTPGRARAYWIHLKDLDPELFEETCWSVVHYEQRFPTVAKFREIYGIVAADRSMHAPVVHRQEDTEAVLREHARLLGVPEEEYCKHYMAIRSPKSPKNDSYGIREEVF